MARLDPGTLLFNSLPKMEPSHDQNALNAATIAAFFTTIVETILTILHELSACCREAPLLRHKAGFLRPAVSALDIPARKRSPDFERAVMMAIKLSHEKARRNPIERVFERDIERILKG
ncbi:hypothetical protein [Taklimakanibacter deserti]|uniref:hypothetical protein n=1 Tax=Taklimakanibacter deserti TaxID=2267839 RepID=UPI000E655E3E